MSLCDRLVRDYHQKNNTCNTLLLAASWPWYHPLVSFLPSCVITLLSPPLAVPSTGCAHSFITPLKGFLPRMSFPDLIELHYPGSSSLNGLGSPQPCSSSAHILIKLSTSSHARPQSLLPNVTLLSCMGSRSPRSLGISFNLSNSNHGNIFALLQPSLASPSTSLIFGSLALQGSLKSHYLR